MRTMNPIDFELSNYPDIDLSFVASKYTKLTNHLIRYICHISHHAGNNEIAVQGR